MSYYGPGDPIFDANQRIMHSPPRCPKCRGLEDIKETCRSCGYEYSAEDSAEDTPLTTGEKIFLGVIFTLVGVLVLWFVAIDTAPEWAKSHGLLF